MLVVLATCHRDTMLALQNAEWIASLAGRTDHKWIVACNQIAGGTDMPQRIADALRTKYPNVEILVHYDSEERGWPRAQNHMFQRCAQYVAGKYNEPWLFLECDAIPMGDGWLDRLDEEYKRSGKLFMGMLVDVTQSNGQPIPQHMSGVAVYPGDVAQHSVGMMRCGGTAFDMAGADEVIPKAHFTKLIHHVYQSPSFQEHDPLDRINKEAVLFHQCKDDSLIQILRKRKSDGIAFWKETYTNSVRPIDPVVLDRIIAEKTGSIVCDIFIKTFPRDYPWLQYCLKSIDKFAVGFRKVEILQPGGLDDFIKTTGHHGPRGSISYTKTFWKMRPDQEPGYLWQQTRKLYADEYTDADFVLFLDSDCILTRPVTPETFLRDGKVMWNYTPFAYATDQERNVWKRVISKFMNEAAEASFMTRHPFLFPRWLFSELRNFCVQMHRQSLSDYIMAQASPDSMLTFSEFNCAGAYAYKYHRDKFVWLNTVQDEIPPKTIFQGFTHGGEDRMHQDITAFRDILGLNDTQPEDVAPKEPESITLNVSSTPMSVKELVGSLAVHAQKDGFAKGRVIRQLQLAGIVPAKKKK